MSSLGSRLGKPPRHDQARGHSLTSFNLRWKKSAMVNLRISGTSHIGKPVNSTLGGSSVPPAAHACLWIGNGVTINVACHVPGRQAHGIFNSFREYVPSFRLSPLERNITVRSMLLSGPAVAQSTCCAIAFFASKLLRLQRRSSTTTVTYGGNRSMETIAPASVSF